MALNLTLLTNQIEAAMKVSQLDPSVQSQRKMAQDLANAIDVFVRGAKI